MTGFAVTGVGLAQANALEEGVWGRNLPKVSPLLARPTEP
jgi:hypothetical protein